MASVLSHIYRIGTVTLPYMPLGLCRCNWYSTHPQIDYLRQEEPTIGFKLVRSCTRCHALCTDRHAPTYTLTPQSDQSR